MRNAPIAGSSPFAHLGRSRAAAEDEQEDKDAKKAKKAKAEEGDDEDEPKEEPKGKKAKKAEEQDDTDSKAKGKKAKASEEEDDDEPKGKKAKKADADGDEDEEDEQDADARAARARERRRIRAILVSEPGKANPVAAAHLATGTAMPRGQAIELLSAMQAGHPVPAAAASSASSTGRDDLRSRMAEVPNASVGSDVGKPALNMAEQIVLAGKKRRGEA